MSDNKFNHQPFSDTSPEQENNQEKDESYTFIQEIIRPRKRTRFKKLGFTIVLGVIFGGVACFTFCALHPFISDIFENEEEPVVVDGTHSANSVTVSSTPTRTPTPTPTATPTPAPTVQPSKSPEIGKNSDDEYTSFVMQLKNVQDIAGGAIVSVNGVRTGTDILDNPDEDDNYASGLIIYRDDNKILIMTNSEIVDGASYITVTLSGEVNQEAKLYSINKQLGIALVSVKISQLDDRLLQSMAVVEMGDSSIVKVGDPVIALGNPNGYMNSVDYGVIANTQHDNYITDRKVQLMNTTISKNTNGYGFIFDIKGRIIGIITHKENFVSDNNANLNTCLSMSSIRLIIEKMINLEQNLYLGIVGNDIDSTVSGKLGVEQGIYITKVEDNSPAFVAGMQKGDILIQMNDTQLTSMNNFSNALNELTNGAQAELHILRKQDGVWTPITLYAAVIVAK